MRSQPWATELATAVAERDLDRLGAELAEDIRLQTPLMMAGIGCR